MKDTSPEMERRYRDLLMSQSPARRAAMASDMFACAQQLALASLTPEERTSKSKVRQHLFLRFYGNDFDEKQKAAILKWLSEGPDS